MLQFREYARLLPVLVIFAYSHRLPAQGTHTDSLAGALLLAKHDSTRTMLMFELGREYWFNRNVSAGAAFLKKSVALAEISGHSRHQADAYNLLANIYMKQELFDSAFICLQKALDQRNKKYFPLICETYSKLHYQLGDYQSSLQYALQSVDAYEKSNDPAFRIQAVFAYLMVGDVFNRLGQDDRAFDYYSKAYRQARTQGTNWYIKGPIQKIAAYYLAKNEWDKARHLYDTILAIDKDAPSVEPVMHSFEGLGNISIREHNYPKAIAYYHRALQYARHRNLSINIGNFYTRLGAAFLEFNQNDSAAYYLRLAIAESGRSRSYVNLSEAYYHLSVLQQRQKRYPEALVSFRLHKDYNDSTLSIEKIRSVNNLEVLYRTRQKENEILRLQQAQQEHDFAIRKRNIYVGIGIGLVAAMGVILLLLRRNYRHQQHLQEEKVSEMERRQEVVSLQAMIHGQEAERTRVARDLHDGLGGLFSTVKMYFSTLEHENEALKANDLFRKGYALVDNASVEIRRIAHNMMPEVLTKMGLVNAVKDLSDHTSAGRFLKVSLEVHGMNQRLGTGVEIMLYRIIQELLNNILKHARATEAIIQFIKDGNRLSVVVEDNGQGFDTLSTDKQIHTGLAVIKSRVSYLNGKLTIDSQKGVGTTVMMDFCIDEISNNHHLLTGNNGLL